MSIAGSSLAQVFLVSTDAYESVRCMLSVEREGMTFLVVDVAVAEGEIRNSVAGFETGEGGTGLTLSAVRYKDEASATAPIQSPTKQRFLSP